MNLVCRKKEISERWKHDPALRDIHGNTVAMYLV